MLAAAGDADVASGAARLSARHRSIVISFTGFSQEQANPDMGDSAITETFGIGGAAMIAAPGVTRFVGAGGMEAARAVYQA